MSPLTPALEGKFFTTELPGKQESAHLWARLQDFLSLNWTIVQRLKQEVILQNYESNGIAIKQIQIWVLILFFSLSSVNHSWQSSLGM